MKTITIDIANASHEALGSVLNVALTHGLSFTFTTDGPLKEDRQPVAEATAPRPAPAPRKRSRPKRVRKVKPKPAATPAKPPVAAKPPRMAPEEVERILLGRVVTHPGMFSKHLRRSDDGFSSAQKGRALQRLREQGLIEQDGERGGANFTATPKGTAAWKPAPPAPKAPEEAKAAFEPAGDGVAVRRGKPPVVVAPAPEPVSKAVPPHKRQKKAT